jgi:hypothetical protein
LKGALRKASTPLAALLLVSSVFVAYTNVAMATHQPADKVQASGSDIEHVEDGTVVLAERMRVSSPSDLIIQVTAECSILTALTTNNDTPSATATGSVRFHVEVDGVPVPVALDEGVGSDDAEDDDNEVGEVTFCNRAYSRTVVDEENPLDGIDEESDYIRTRTANAFNWFAINTGELYDNPANGKNILDIEVIADYDTTTSGDNAIADAFVGSRTLIVEPVHSQNDQVVAPE